MDGAVQVIGRWAIGFGVSLGLGALITSIFLRMLRQRVGVSSSGTNRVSPWITGIVERTFFTIVVAFANHAAAESLRKGTVVAVSPRLLVRTTAAAKALTAWVRDPLRVVVIEE
jgi:hypothetical protein